MLRNPSTLGVCPSDACGDRPSAKQIQRYAPRQLTAACPALLCWVRVPTSNIRFRQSNTGTSPSNSGEWPSGVRTRPKNIRPIGPPRAELRRQRLDVDSFRLKRRCPRVGAGCQRSKISSSNIRMRLFEGRLPLAEVRRRQLSARVRASNARGRVF